MAADLFRFDDFELDGSAHELRRAGRVVRLERIPLDLLFFLSERRGQLVTREEILEQIWGKDVFVDVDNSINTAVRKIRQALRDNPERPRYLHTISGKGYRFSPPILGSSQPSSAPTSPSVIARDPESPDVLAQKRFDGGSGKSAEPTDPAPRHDSVSVPRRTTRRRLAFGATAVVAIVVLVYVFTRPMPSPHVSGFRRISNDGSGKRGPLAADGLRVYFTAGSVNSATLDQVSGSGGETVALPAPFGIPRLLDMSPSRSELLVSTVVDVRRASPLWLLPLPAGMPRRLGDVLADDATWSPDGREIVYVRGQDVYRAKKDGSDVRKLVTLPAVPSWPRWSPDGTRLRLTLTDNQTGVSSLWEMSVDGKRVHPLLPGWNPSPAECCGSWTSDGKYFVFQSTQNDKTDIWVMAERRGVLGVSANTVSTPEQLTAGQLNSLAPVLSPDNKTVYVIGEQLRGELVRYDSKSRQFVTYSSGMSAEFVDFSSDGQWMTYVAFPEGTLWRSRTDGTERLQLTFPSARVTAPRWAPDGRRIAFFDASPGKPWRMYVVAADGGRPEPLLEEPHNQMDPNWSPDGNAVVFSYFPLLETSTSEILAIYLLDLKTHHVTKLPGSDGLWAPRWSRDGRYIVARASADAPRLLLFDFETQKWVELIRDTAGWANWSRDGQYIYYLRRGKEPAILRVRVSDHSVEEVASLKDVRQTGFRAGVWTGLAPDDSPLVLRDIGSREIYALDWDVR